ncbi:hypothetical protein Lbir_1531 [Legionella birminghamensis]|uniref:Uncharacterized protein n=1 Tax=Legionella birminghamensis TaxID=28083 RepID=A0A378IC43_9GAMM|nr:hypothetical protein [Legionella birminghamensis]KTC71676.1 hypothetical protein Lbir_1531 [Legionella birminghamensis]STX32486.1 Uncharacterised protein [Legionella birminghamensis]
MKKDNLVDGRSSQSSAGFFSHSANASQPSLLISDTYQSIVMQYYQASHYLTKAYILRQLSELRTQEHESAQPYLEWFESNIEKLSAQDFGEMALYTPELQKTIL